MKRYKWYLKIAVGFLLFSLNQACPETSIREKDPCKNPEYVNVLKEQIRDHYGKGDFRIALKAAMDAQECRPEDPEIQYWLGICYFRLERYTEAEKHLKAAEKKQEENSPEIGETRMALGIIYLNLQRWDEAIQAFSSVANNLFFPRNYEAMNNLGWSYFEKGDLENAEANFKQAIKQNSTFCPAHSNLGELYAKQNKSSLAISSYQKAVEQCPEYPRPHLLLGIEYNRLDSLVRACKEFHKADSADPEGPDGSKALDFIQLLNCPPPPNMEEITEP